jgi:hypothetical protein
MIALVFQGGILLVLGSDLIWLSCVMKEIPTSPSRIYPLANGFTSYVTRIGVLPDLLLLRDPLLVPVA